MAKGTLLITGATGFVGSAILIAALQNGYRVHIVVRSAAKEDYLKNAPAVASLKAEMQCKYFIVPDLTLSGALDEAAVGADFVIHAASPLPSQVTTPDRDYEDIIRPAVANTITALESARKAKTVKRFVCITSLIAFTKPEIIYGDSIPPSEDVVVSDKTMNDHIIPPYGGGLLTYGAAKTEALLKSLEWMRNAEANPGGAGFDLINIAPCYVIGRHPLAESTEDLFASSNMMVLRSAAGTTSSDVIAVSGGIHIDDVVQAHLRALDIDEVKLPQEGPNKGIGNFALGVTWNYEDINAAVERLWPDEVKNGLLPNQGHFLARPRVSIDVSKPEKILGIRFRGLDEQLKSIIPQYLDLLAKEKGTANQEGEQSKTGKRSFLP